MYKYFSKIFFFLSLLFLWFPNVVQAVEQVMSFNSEITINQDTSVSIKETIQYFTTEEKHGIYRYIPTRYHREGLSYTAKVRDIEIADEKGEEINFEKSFENGNVMLKIGDADITFSGQKTYVISYKVENAVSELPELFWDITGEGWQVDIAKSTATIISPHAKITNLDCFSGVVGSNDQQCQPKKINDNQAVFSYSQLITYGDNMTVAVGLDSTNNLQFPTPTQKLIKQIVDNLTLIPLFLPGVIMVYWWSRKGRDHTFTSWNVFNHDETQPTTVAPLWNLRHVPFVYEPLKDLTPGETGAILNEKIDNQDIVAEIVDLARKKFLKIDRIEKKKLLILNDNDYQFTKLKDSTANLPEHQRYLLEKIFATGEVVKMSELKGSFYTYIEKMKQKMFASLVKKGLFKANPQNTQGLAFGVAIALIVICGTWGIMLLEQGLWWALPISAVSDVIALLCAYYMPAKTAKGSNYAWQAKGLRKSIQYGAWREKIKEKHLFFEEVLPFAIALGVVDQLSKDMEALNIKPPQYLNSSLHNFSTHSFVSSFTSQASSNLTYNPNSSSWSGGSSGGSSGGGGGGGGGGSW